MIKGQHGRSSQDRHITRPHLTTFANKNEVMENFEEQLRNDLHQFLLSMKEAFNGYVACLHQLYLFGAAMQLNRMGYHMTKMN